MLHQSNNNALMFIATTQADCYITPPMRSNHLKITLCLILSLFVWGQVALAEHSFEHLFHDAHAACEVYKGAENSFAIAISTPEINTSYSPSAANFSIACPTHSTRIQRATARAPPQH